MSENSRTRKNLRVVKRTVLIFGEGLAEAIFIKYLRDLYSFNKGVSIKVHKGKGGDAVSMVHDAMRFFGDYDRRIVVLDSDKSKEEMGSARLLAATYDVILIESIPCIEASLLQILTGSVYANKSSAQCKSEFESRFIHKTKRGVIEEYAKHFPRHLLDQKRASVEALNQIINILEGNF